MSTYIKSVLADVIDGVLTLPEAFNRLSTYRGLTNNEQAKEDAKELMDKLDKKMAEGHLKYVAGILS